MGASAFAAQLTFDANTGTAGVQNGSGTWNLTNTNWFDGANNSLWDNSGTAIAAFGTNATKTGGTITVEGTIKVGGLLFNPLSPSSVADLPVTSAYTITGGTLQFADDAIIEASNNSSSGSSGVLFINLVSALEGHNLTVQRPDETRINAFQYVRFSTANPNLTGVLNINSRSTTNGIFMLLAGSSTVSSLDSLVVQSGSVLATGGTGHTYITPMTIGGNGQGNGAIRVDSSNMHFTGEITLSEDAALLTNRNIINTTIEAPITDGGGLYGFQRFATSANSVLTLSGTSTYGGTTTIGRSGSAAGGITILDFSATGAPAADMLYNGLANAGGLTLSGGTAGTSTFILQGKDGTDNSQRFGDVSISGTRSNLILTPGEGGSMNVSLGNITRVSPASVTFTSDIPGAITTTTADGFLGPWSALVNSAGNGAWVNVEAGKLTAFLGSTEYITGAELSSLGASSDVAINATSTGNVLGGSGTYQVNTLSMNDATSDRVVDIGASNVLRLGSTGGIQLTRDAMSLDIGISGSAGALRAGTGTGQLWLTNLSKTGILTIHSVIENNGSSVLSLYFNGMGKTVLAGANTFTGATQISSGEVEVAHSSALGTGSSATTVLYNGTLRLTGGISLDKIVNLNGFGVNGMGALVNTSGINEITQKVTVVQPSRINSESGTLIFKAADGTTDAINASGTGATTAFGGSGDITIQGRLNAAANTISKDGAGTLTFAGTQIFTAAVTPTAGTVHLDFSAATSPATNILYNGVTAAALSLSNSTLKITGKSSTTNSQNFGNLTLTNYANINLYTNGASSLTTIFGTVTRNFGSILGLEIPAGSNVRVNTGSDNTLLTSNGRPYAYIRDDVNGDEWAGTGALSSGTRPIVKLSTLSGMAGYTASTTSSLSGNANIAPGILTTTLASSTTIDTLRFAQAQTTEITDAGAGTTLTVGGILVSSTVGENASTISVGTLRASPSTVSVNPDLTIVQNNAAAPLIINSVISNSLGSTGAAATVSLAKSGPGLVVLSGANTFSGNVRIYEGAIQFAGGSVSSSIEFLLGSGASSGKVILGKDNTVFSPTMDYIQVVGVGTDNRIVGGATNVSRLTLTGVSNPFATGYIGGPGTNENNLELRLASLNGLLTLGSSNTYSGRTILSRGTLQIEKLANVGEISSLGTGDFNSSAATITLSDATTGALNSYATSVLHYVGSTDSTTNRALNLTNSDASTDITAVTGVLENTGTGTLKFTAPFLTGGNNPVDRVWRLTGTNMGLNEIVSIGDASASIPSRLEKQGLGTWALTGNSTHTGETTISEGTLLANNPLTGSATGFGNVRVEAAGTLGGIGRIAPADGNPIIISGGRLSPGMGGLTNSAGLLTLETSGAGMLTLENGASIIMDLYSGASSGDNTLNTSSADQLVILGQVSFGTNSTLKVLNPTGMTAWAADDQWKLFDWSGLTSPVIGTFENYDLPALPEGLFWNTDDLFTTGVLSITVVPEPSKIGLIGLAVIGMCLRRRRGA